MRRNVLITVTMLAIVAAALYAARAMDLVGMIIRGHGGMNIGGHS